MARSDALLENSSAALYANRFPGWSLSCACDEPAYLVRIHRWHRCSNGQRFDALVIDSTSHAWKPGRVDSFGRKEEPRCSRRKQNKFTNWAEITKDTKPLETSFSIHPFISLQRCGPSRSTWLRTLMGNRSRRAQDEAATAR